VIPLRDANPTRSRPIVTYGLIVLCFAVFGLELWIQSTDGERGLERFLLAYGFVPDQLSGALGTGAAHPSGSSANPFLGLITSQFLHGGWIHIGGNMLYLWIFGNNVEDRFGRVRFLLFYLAGGVVAGLSQFAIDPHSTNPLVGASGAIAAVLGAYVALFPGARVLSLVFLGFFYQLINVPAVVVLVFWFVLQLLSGVGSLGAGSSEGGVAFFAHIGGFVAGVVVGLLVRTFGGRSRGPAERSAGRFGVG
jgi:membrane associated rhomboid family serine protease